MEWTLLGYGMDSYGLWNGLAVGLWDEEYYMGLVAFRYSDQTVYLPLAAVFSSSKTCFFSFVRHDQSFIFSSFSAAYLGVVHVHMPSLAAFGFEGFYPGQTICHGMSVIAPANLAQCPAKWHLSSFHTR